MAHVFFDHPRPVRRLNFNPVPGTFNCRTSRDFLRGFSRRVFLFRQAWDLFRFEARTLKRLPEFPFSITFREFFQADPVNARQLYYRFSFARFIRVIVTVWRENTVYFVISRGEGIKLTVTLHEALSFGGCSDLTSLQLSKLLSYLFLSRRIARAFSPSSFCHPPRLLA